VFLPGQNCRSLGYARDDRKKRVVALRHRFFMESIGE
jgi:hypothetical protein